MCQPIFDLSDQRSQPLDAAGHASCCKQHYVSCRRADNHCSITLRLQASPKFRHHHPSTDIRSISGELPDGTLPHHAGSAITDEIAHRERVNRVIAESHHVRPRTTDESSCVGIIERICTPDGAHDVTARTTGLSRCQIPCRAERLGVSEQRSNARMRTSDVRDGLVKRAHDGLDGRVQ